MALNFTGRLQAPEPSEAPAKPSRRVLAILALAAAAFLAALIVFARTNPKPAPKPEPVLVGVSAPATPAPIEARPIPIAAPASAPRAAKAEPAAPAGPTPRQKFVAALRRTPGQITLMVEDDAEARAYGQELRTLFEQAGWTVSLSQAFGSGAPTRGLAVALGDTPQDAAVAEAFAAAGIKIVGQTPSGGIVQTPEIFVGPPLSPKTAPAR